MGFFDSSSTSGTKYSPGVEKIQNDLIDAAGKGTEGWFSNPGYTVAPQNPWQTRAGQGFGDLFGQGADGSYSGQMANIPAVSVNDIMGYADPLADLMTERGMNAIGDQYQTGAKDIANNQAAQNAFSGSGSAAALERAALSDSAVDASKDLALGADAAGLQYGAGLAEGNANRRLAGLSAADQSRLQALGLDQQTLGLLGAFGEQQNQHDQRVNDQDYTEAMRWLGMIPGIEGKTTTSNNPSWMQNIGAIGSTLLPFF